MFDRKAASLPLRGLYTGPKLLGNPLFALSADLFALAAKLQYKEKGALRARLTRGRKRVAILKRGEFWLMIAAMIAHSLSTTSWSSYSLIAWFVGMLLIWSLYGMCRLEAHRKRGNHVE